MTLIFLLIKQIKNKRSRDYCLKGLTLGTDFNPFNEVEEHFLSRRENTSDYYNDISDNAV